MIITPMESREFDGVYRLLQISFPPQEIRSYAAQKKLLEDPRYEILLCRDARGEAEALMALWRFPEFTFLEHFAVAPASRCRGLGGKMLNWLLAGETVPVCLEAELPENEIARRRIGFYRRNGFFVNSYPYIQPSLGKGRSPVPLQILTTGGKVSPETFARIKTLLYRHVYRAEEEKETS